MAVDRKKARRVSFYARVVALSLLFVAGVLFAAYPFINNFMYQMRANEQLDSLSQTIGEGDKKVYAAEIIRAQKYNTELVGQTVPDVFAIREGTVDKTYESFLNVQGNQIMGEINIPVIKVHLPIYHYSTEESLKKGCGHIFGSSLPVGGEDSHAVITAHRGLPAAKLFTDLDQVEVGDKFFIKVLGETLAYEVDNIEIVEPHETRSLAIQRGEDLVTLVTCTPYGVNTDRLLVRGHRVPYVPEEEASAAPHASSLLRNLAMIGCVVLGVVAALGLRKLSADKRDKNGKGGMGPKDGPQGPAGMDSVEVGSRREKASGSGLFYD